MTKVMLQPCGKPAQQNFDATVRAPVPRDVILSHVADPDRHRLSELLRDLPAVATWGMINSDNTSQQKAWREVKRGDVVVFAGLKMILATGTFFGGVESSKLGDTLFQRQEDGRGFEFIYFIDDLITHQFITWDEFRSVVPYRERDRPHNARLLDDEKSTRVLEWLAPYRDPSLDSKRLEAVNVFLDDDADDLDEEGARIYTQQRMIERSRKNRARVLAAKGYVCEVCGYTFTDQFRGFAPSTHVHHKEPLAAGKRRPQVSDFAVLCAPCHTAAHMGKGRKLEPWPIEKLQTMITRRWDR